MVLPRFTQRMLRGDMQTRNLRQQLVEKFKDRKKDLKGFHTFFDLVDNNRRIKIKEIRIKKKEKIKQIPKLNLFEELL